MKPTLLIALFSMLFIGCGSEVPPSKTDPESIKASQDAQKRLAEGSEGAPATSPAK